MKRAGLAAILIISPWACSDPAPLASVPVGDASPQDASTAVLDAGIISPEDASLPADSGPTDAEPPDAGPVPDEGPPVETVRFVAVGDTGEGNEAQYAVAAVMQNVCAVQGCDFALLLGDNFYDDGVYAIDDEQFESKFEAPYANLDFPFYVTLGNHDFGEIPLQFLRTDYQVDYTMMSTKWILPDHFYEFVERNVTFISLDTNMIMLGFDWVRNQRTWFQERIAQVQTPWVIAYGHHPYRSNGPHGNAGNYEGASFDITGVVRGAEVQAFFEEEMCFNVDVYFAGHDHSRQWLQPACGVSLIVSGAGAKLTDLVRRDNNPTKWEDNTKEGFVWVEIAGQTMTIEFWDRDGQMGYSDVILK